MRSDSTNNYDLIVVGSGMAGLHSAYEAVEKGLRVAMLDIGTQGYGVLEQGEPLDFETMRRTNPEQYKIFLGEDYSGIGGGDGGHAAAMTSGRRSFIARGSDTLLPVDAPGAMVVQSTAQGGLSEAWGGVCDFFDAEELDAVGIPAQDFSHWYQTIIDRIGVSGPRGAYRLQPPAQLDENARTVTTRYGRRQRALERLGFSLAQPALALLTEDFAGRKKTAYRDMDFWDNIGRSIYRGHYTLEVLRAHENFTYVPNTLVMRITQANTAGATVEIKNLETEEKGTYRAKAVIVAGGAIGTTRILLRSFGLYGQPVPIILKNNYLVPCLDLARLGRSGAGAQHSLCQLVLRGNRKEGGMMAKYAQLYSYRSLLLYKLLPYVPMAAPEAFAALSMLTPALILADIRFPSLFHGERYAALRRGNSEEDYLEISYGGDAHELAAQAAGVKTIKRALRALSLLPLTVVRNPYGATSHYAGGVPFSSNAEEFPLSVNAQGQLHRAPSIFVADAAAWRALPAQPHSLTLMANAARIGRQAQEYVASITQ